MPTSLAPRLSVLWSFARPHRRTLIQGLCLALVASALGLATPMVTKHVLDALGSASSLTGPVAALVVLLVVGAAVSYRQWTLLGALGERVVLDARESIVRRFLRATVPGVTRSPTGELVTRVTSDTELLREAAASSFVGLINGAVMLVGSLVLMGLLDPVLLAATVAAVALVGVVFGLLMPGIAQSQQQSQEHVGRLGGILEGTLRAIRTVKVNRAEDRMTERILADARASAEHGVRAVRREALAWTTAWPVRHRRRRTHPAGRRPPVRGGLVVRGERRPGMPGAAEAPRTPGPPAPPGAPRRRARPGAAERHRGLRPGHRGGRTGHRPRHPPARPHRGRRPLGSGQDHPALPGAAVPGADRRRTAPRRTAVPRPRPRRHPGPPRLRRAGHPRRPGYPPRQPAARPARRHNGGTAARSARRTAHGGGRRPG